ncbi:RNA 2',3'-cyclic phosphodiesterase [Labilibacter sediminis]|nr:RNA 2',3'-cyclic phosphodiesterase [Labilibacter sediminis]
MRVFIGIKISEPSQLSEIKTMINHSYSEHFKWVKKENLHLTLCFIGNISPMTLRVLNKNLKQSVSDYPNFNLKINGSDTFSKRHKKSILWLKVVPHKKLLHIQQNIAGLVTKLLPEHKEEYDSYTPHITIARYKRNINIKKLMPELLSKHHSSIQNIKEIQLFESCSTPHGIEYRILESYKLNG